MKHSPIRRDQHRGGVTSAGKAQIVGGESVDAIPGGKIHVVVMLHWKGFVQVAQDIGGITEVRVNQGGSAQHVHHADGEQGSTDTVPADIEQIQGERVVVDPVIAEGISPKLRGGDEHPVRGNW